MLKGVECHLFQYDEGANVSKKSGMKKLVPLVSIIIIEIFQVVHNGLEAWCWSCNDALSITRTFDASSPLLLAQHGHTQRFRARASNDLQNQPTVPINPTTTPQSWVKVRTQAIPSPQIHTNRQSALSRTLHNRAQAHNVPQESREVSTPPASSATIVARDDGPISTTRSASLEPPTSRRRSVAPPTPRA